MVKFLIDEIRNGMTKAENRKKRGVSKDTIRRRISVQHRDDNDNDMFEQHVSWLIAKSRSSWT